VPSRRSTKSRRRRHSDGQAARRSTSVSSIRRLVPTNVRRRPRWSAARTSRRQARWLVRDEDIQELQHAERVPVGLPGERYRGRTPLDHVWSRWVQGRSGLRSDRTSTRGPDPCTVSRLLRESPSYVDRNTRPRTRYLPAVDVCPPPRAEHQILSSTLGSQTRVEIPSS